MIALLCEALDRPENILKSSLLALSNGLLNRTVVYCEAACITTSSVVSGGQNP